jgi:hypothetical protein
MMVMMKSRESGKTGQTGDLKNLLEKTVTRVKQWRS